MAWSEQCRVSFQMTANVMIAKQKKRKNITKVLKELSVESGIPLKTLNRWFYEKENHPKNGATQPTIENNTENNTNEVPAVPVVRKKCSACKKNNAELDSTTGEVYGQGLCTTCRKKKTAIVDNIKELVEMADAVVDDMIVCPHCNKAFYIKKEK